MYLDQFIDQTGTNNDLEDLVSFQNLGYGNSKYWYSKSYVSTGVVHEVYSVDSITGTSTLEEDQTYAILEDSWLIYSVITKTWGSNIYSVISFRTISGSTYGFFVYIIYSNDNGSSWNYAFPAIYAGASSGSTIQSLDLFEINSKAYVCYGYNLAGYDLIVFKEVGVGGTELFTLTADTYETFYNGYNDGSAYYFVARQNGTTLHTYKFVAIGTAVSDEETLTGLSAAISKDASVQLYWKQGSHEILMDKDHLYYRKIGETSWRSKTGSGETTNGVVWDYDADGNYIIKYIFWKDTVFIVTASGMIEEIQLTTPRDFKKFWGNNTDLTGVIQWGTSEDPDLRDWNEVGAPTLSIIGKIDSHQNVMQLDDLTGYVNVSYAWDSNEIDQTVEIFFGKSSIGSGASTFNFKFGDDAGNVSCQMRLEGNDLDAYYSATFNSVYDDWIVVYTLYVFQIIFNDTAKTYDININGVSRGTDIPYRSASANGIKTVFFSTDSADTGYQCWVDGIGRTGDSYVIGSMNEITAYVGWKDWISNGSNALYQIESVQTHNGIDFTVFNVNVDYNQGQMQFWDYTTTAIWEKNDYIVCKTVHDSTTYDLFEGKIIDINYDNPTRKVVSVEAPWYNDLRQSKVTTSYIGQTAATILESIINNYSTYSSATTTSSTTTYSITYQGKNILDTIRPLAQSEGWMWYVTPDQTVHINDGTTDSGIDVLLDTTTSNFNAVLSNVKTSRYSQEISTVTLTGGYVGGSRLTSTYTTTTAVNSKILYDNYPEITDQITLDGMAEAIGLNRNNEILQIEFQAFDVPPVQYGEQIDFQYTPLSSKESVLGSSAKYFVNLSKYREDGNIAEIAISDVLILGASEGENQDGVNSQNDQQLLDQVAGT